MIYAKREITERRDPILEFSQRIVGQFELRVKPWVKPWDWLKCFGRASPFNPVIPNSLSVFRSYPHQALRKVSIGVGGCACGPFDSPSNSSLNCSNGSNGYTARRYARLMNFGASG
jgi:hypothetical protein